MNLNREARGLISAMLRLTLGALAEARTSNLVLMKGAVAAALRGASGNWSVRATILERVGYAA